MAFLIIVVALAALVAFNKEIEALLAYIERARSAKRKKV